MKRIKILLSILLLGIFFSLPNAVLAEEEDYVIDSNVINDSTEPNDCLDGYCIKHFSINVIVNEDNTFDITEKIDVFFTEQKHGIYRDIPIKNTVTRNDGTSYTNRAKITNIEVSEKYSKSNVDGHKRLKIGYEDKTITGDHSYTIKYKYDIGKDKTKDYDELYFNLVGYKWTSYIENIDFSITMPKEYDKSKIGFSTGAVGNIGSNDVEYDTDGNTITGKYTKRLSPGEAITVRIELPNNYFIFKYKLNIFNIILMVVPFLFAIISFRIFRKNGVDDVVVETVEFYPPENYNSLDLGYFYKERSSSQDAVSLLIYLANKGYIKITDRDENGELLKHSNFIITKVKEYDGNDNREREFLEGLFKKRPKLTLFGKKDDDSNGEITKVEKSDLTNSFYTTINSIVAKTNSSENRNKLFDKEASKKGKVIWLMMFITFILIIVNLLSNGLALEDLLSFGIFALAAFITFIVGFALVLARFFDKNQYLKGTGSAFGPPLMMIIGIIVFALIVVPIVIETVDIDTLFIVSISVCILCLAIMMASSFCLTKRTPYGAELAGKIRGFKNFLETAEKSKLEDLVSENPTYFYDILPYTYVLGVSKKWVSKFESIAIEPPNWYDTNNAAFNVGMMSTFMDKTMVSAASTLNSSPSDSGGSGGGGSSGGGSGGGGGGSW